MTLPKMSHLTQRNRIGPTESGQAFGRSEKEMKRVLLPLTALVVSLLLVGTPFGATAVAQTESSEAFEHQARFDALVDVGFNHCGNFTGHFVYKDHETCAGEVPSFDGVELEGRIVFPTNAGSGPLPLVVMFHGWGGNRVATFGDGRGEAFNDWDKAVSNWEPAVFLSRGYAVLAYTARGFAASCGTFDAVMDSDADGGTGPLEEDPAGCVDGHTHIAEREYEVRDTQYLLGKLVDVGVADAERLVAVGGSYGGGQAWMLATSRPWPTPLGNGPISLAAAVAKEGWTDFFDALAPNGRATDSVDQRRSTEVPFGVLKESIFYDLYRRGRGPAPLIDFAPHPIWHLDGGRFNVTKPEELHSYFDGWAAVFAAGEPHASPEAQALPAALRGKSAFYDEDGYLAEVAARNVDPVPIFAVQGWTDPLFPAVQSLQMYRKLKAAHPGYPISLVLGDIGHNGQSPDNQMDYWTDHAIRFIDAAMAGVEPERVVASFPTSCDGSGSLPAAAGNWDALQKQSVLFESFEPATTDSVTSNLAHEAATDPVVMHSYWRLDNETPVGAAITSDHVACMTAAGGSSASGATWRFPQDPDETLEAPLAMLGLPRVSMDYSLTGADATVIAKLWDVGADGSKKTLVTRGVYRLSTAAGDPQAGTISFQLFGNHWRFPAGHKLELEIGQRDAPFFRPNNFQSSLDISRISLEVPTANQ